MSDFDDDKHPRSSDGRFTSGSLGIWARNQSKTTSVETMKVKKGRGPAREQKIPVAHRELKGYTQPAAGTPGKVEGRARDIEVPLLGKNDSVASTGKLDMRPTGFGLRNQTWFRSTQFIDTAYKAQKAATNALILDHKKASDVEERARSKALLKPGDVDEHGKVKDGVRFKGEKGFDRAKARSEDATKKRREVTEKTAEAIGRLHAIQNFKTLVKGDFGFQRVGVQMEISLSRNDGVLQAHASGTSANPDYPGEKELSLEVIPVAAKGMILHPPGGHRGRGEPINNASWTPGSTDSIVRVNINFPSNTKGKDHPYTKSVEFTYGLKVGEKEAEAQKAIENFFNDDYQTPKEEERKPEADIGYKKTSGGGQIWAPKKAT